MILIDENLKSESAMFLGLRQQRCRARLEPKSELKNLSTTIKLSHVCVLTHVRVCIHIFRLTLCSDFLWYANHQS